MNVDIAKSGSIGPWIRVLAAVSALVLAHLTAPGLGAAEEAAPPASPAVPGVVEDAAFLAKLNDQQRAIYDWTNRKFRKFFDYRTFPDLTASERAKLEDKLIDTLRGPLGPDYYQAINTLAALKSRKAAPALLQIAADPAEKDNRDRWMAIRALGLIGDKQGIPEFIHLTYHPNSNTRFWAQITLVRLTGVNFGTDWEAWGKWWNAQGGQPPFKPKKVAWSANAEYMDPAKQRESDAKFVADATGRESHAADAATSSPPPVAAAPADMGETLDRLKEVCRAGFAKAANENDAAGAAQILETAIPDAEKTLTQSKGTAAEAPIAAGVNLLRKAVEELKGGRVAQGVKLLQQLNELGPELEQAVRDAKSPPEGKAAGQSPDAVSSQTTRR